MPFLGDIFLEHDTSSKEGIFSIALSSDRILISLYLASVLWPSPKLFLRLQSMAHAIPTVFPILCGIGNSENVE